MGYHHTFVNKNQDPGAAVTPPNKKKTEQKAAPAQFVIMPQPDLVLRGLLLQKGLITEQELEVVERELSVGPSPRFFSEPPANT
jgi:hypothetical protein